MLLNGKWNLRGADFDGNPISVDGNVPGCVHTDLISAGIIGDIFYRDNSKTVQWIERGDFTYSRTFEIDEVKSGAFLEFDGLDCYSETYLNGVKVGVSDDMFVKYSYPIDGVLRKGENRVEVRFFSPVKKTEKLPKRNAAFTAERLYTRRIQCTYGWDWVDRFVTEGIYKDVRIVYREPNMLAEPYIYTRAITEYAAEVKIKLDFNDFEMCGDEVQIKIISPSGKTVLDKTRTILKKSFTETVSIANPALWFPHGYGEQPLYTLVLKTKNSEKTVNFGIRRIVIHQIEDEEGSEARERALEVQKEDFLKTIDFNKKTASFFVTVNGIRIMCKGANWVPSEPFPSAETEEKLCRLLSLAVDGGFNMLRVWGGGIFEQDFFYDTCDRLGILVTQDFLMACGTYPEEDDGFIASLSREAESAALRLRNHACLAWWSGDNENAVNGDENRTNFDGYRAAAEGIEPVLEVLDPERYFLASSPYGGENYASATRGTTHNTFFLGDFFSFIKSSDMKNYREYFSRFISRFQVEQPALGMPYVSSLRKFMTDEDIFGDDISMSEFHTKNNPGLGGTTLYQYIDMMARKIFGEYEGDEEFDRGRDRILKMQMLHCEWVRLSFELFRRNKWYSAGILYWMFNDCWPAANGWSFIDYYAMPKPAYYMFKRTSEPIVASFEKSGGEYKLYVSNDALRTHSGRAHIYLYDFEKDRELWCADTEFTADENSANCIFSVGEEEIGKLLTPTTVLMADVASSAGQDRAFLIESRYCDLKLKYSTPIVIFEDGDRITVKADEFIPFAIIDCEDVLEENSFPMKKGEVRVVRKVK